MDSEKIISELSFLKQRKSVDGISAFDCSPAQLLHALEVLRDNYEYQSLNDIASLDMGETAEQRFGAVYHLYSHTKKKYVRIVSMCEDSSKPVLPSVCSVYAGADWHEREAFDMMGIVFENHPALRRIMMWNDYPYHPLRKDFPLAGKDAPLPETFDSEDASLKVCAAPEEGGPFHSPSQSSEFASQHEPRSVESFENQ